MEPEAQMLNLIRRVLNGQRNKRFDVSDLQRMVVAEKGARFWDEAGSYPAFAQAIGQLERAGEIAPVKSSGKNGRVPELYSRYTKKDRIDPEMVKVIRFMLVGTPLRSEYYETRPDKFAAHKWFIERIVRYLKSPEEHIRMPLREKSFQIFGHDKFLEENMGMLRSNLGLEPDQLHTYVAYEPYVYIGFTRPGSPFRRVLIVENKDTLDSVARVVEQHGNLLGLPVDGLIYSQGDKLQASFPYTFHLVEKGIIAKDCEFYYFADLDRASIEIYLGLKERFPQFDIKPFYAGYERLAAMAHLSTRTESRQTWNRDNDLDSFVEGFSEPTKDIIRHAVESALIVPQEALSIAEMERGSSAP